jgi:hypothetical protein
VNKLAAAQPARPGEPVAAQYRCQVTRQMWACPSCGRTFANRNQVHTCAQLGDLDRHFAPAEPVVRATFDRVLSVVAALGPFEVLPERTRIALHARMSFAAFMPRRRWLNGHLVLARYLESPRFLRVDTISARNVVHLFRLNSPADVDEEFAAWLAEAYQVGVQAHLFSRAERDVF